MTLKIKILCIVLSIITIMGCSTACAKQEVARDPDALEYDTFAEFETNSTHRHPETDENLRYALYDKYAQVIECISAAEDIVIPDTYKGVPVISIRAGAFQNNKTLKHLVIGQNVLQIGSDAFNGCTSLAQVKMSNSVNEILGGAFANCSSLTSIIIPPKVSVVYSGTFSGCSSLSKVVVESTEMTEQAEENTRQSAEETVKRTIQAGAFSDCSHLSIMWIPEDIAIVEDSILGGSTPKPLICGGDGTASAYFATLQCLDYELVNRDDFDAQARLFKDVNVVDRTEIGRTIQAGLLDITLDEVNYYNKLGSLTASENQTLVVAKFSISHDYNITQYFDGLNVTCKSMAPGKDNVVTEFAKQPIMIATDVLGMQYPVGDVEPGSTLEGIIVLRVSNRFESVSIQFNGMEEPFII